MRSSRMEIEYLKEIHTLFLERSQIPVLDRLKVRMWLLAMHKEASEIEEELRKSGYV